MTWTFDSSRNFNNNLNIIYPLHFGFCALWLCKAALYLLDNDDFQSIVTVSYKTTSVILIGMILRANSQFKNYRL